MKKNIWLILIYFIILLASAGILMLFSEGVGIKFWSGIGSYVIGLTAALISAIECQSSKRSEIVSMLSMLTISGGYLAANVIASLILGLMASDKVFLAVHVLLLAVYLIIMIIAMKGSSYIANVRPDE